MWQKHPWSRGWYCANVVVFTSVVLPNLLLCFRNQSVDIIAINSQSETVISWLRLQLYMGARAPVVSCDASLGACDIWQPLRHPVEFGLLIISGKVVTLQIWGSNYLADQIAIAWAILFYDYGQRLVSTSDSHPCKSLCTETRHRCQPQTVHKAT